MKDYKAFLTKSYIKVDYQIRKKPTIMVYCVANQFYPHFTTQ